MDIISIKNPRYSKERFALKRQIFFSRKSFSIIDVGRNYVIMYMLACVIILYTKDRNLFLIYPFN